MNTLHSDAARLNDDSRSTLAAYFRNPDDAEKAIADLSSAGFSKKEIGVALREHDGDASGRAAGSSGWSQRLRNMFSPAERDEYASDDAMDVLDHMGIPPDQGRYFKDALRDGGVLVTVHAGDRDRQAYSILHGYNAVTSENFASQPRRDSRQVTDSENRRIQLLGETLRVNKERVQSGSVTLKKKVVTEHQNIEVPVSREELVVERHAADGQAVRGNIGDNKQVTIPLSEERVRVEKRPVVREEVEIGKRQVQDTKKVSDDIRHEELRVEKEGNIREDRSDVDPLKRKRA
jgi:uncharacterized protein (TIGR02271 family)